jgi:hypothetical protein
VPRKVILIRYYLVFLNQWERLIDGWKEVETVKVLVFGNSVPKTFMIADFPLPPPSCLDMVCLDILDASRETKLGTSDLDTGLDMLYSITSQSLPSCRACAYLLRLFCRFLCACSLLLIFDTPLCRIFLSSVVLFCRCDCLLSLPVLSRSSCPFLLKNVWLILPFGHLSPLFSTPPPSVLF